MADSTKNIVSCFGSRKQKPHCYVSCVSLHCFSNMYSLPSPNPLLGFNLFYFFLKIPSVHCVFLEYIFFYCSQEYIHLCSYEHRAVLHKNFPFECFPFVSSPLTPYFWKEQVDITYFPFDWQRCTLKFGSWSYDKAQVDLLNKTSVVEVTNYVTNGEWTLHKYDIIRNEVGRHLDICIIFPTFRNLRQWASLVTHPI